MIVASDATYRFRFPIHPSRPRLEDAGPRRNWEVCPDCEHIRLPPGSHLVPGTPKVPKLGVRMQKAFQTEMPETVGVKAIALFTQTGPADRCLLPDLDLSIPRPFLQVRAQARTRAGLSGYILHGSSPSTFGQSGGQSLNSPATLSMVRSMYNFSP
jgi:hypothetical protein